MLSLNTNQFIIEYVKLLRVHERPLSGDAVLPFPSLPPIPMGQLLRERICSSWNTLFSLRNEPYFGRVLLPGKQTESQKLFPFTKRDISIFF